MESRENKCIIFALYHKGTKCRNEKLKDLLGVLLLMKEKKRVQGSHCRRCKRGSKEVASRAQACFARMGSPHGGSWSSLCWHPEP